MPVPLQWVQDFDTEVVVLRLQKSEQRVKHPQGMLSLRITEPPPLQRLHGCDQRSCVRLWSLD